MPFVSPALALHASVEFSAATPPVLINNISVTGVVRTGAGDWTLTLADEIDPTARQVFLTVHQAAAGTVQIGADALTDTTFQILGFIDDVVTGIPAAGDLAIRVAVYRVTSPS